MVAVSQDAIAMIDQVISQPVFVECSICCAEGTAFRKFDCPCVDIAFCPGCVDKIERGAQDPFCPFCRTPVPRPAGFVSPFNDFQRALWWMDLDGLDAVHVHRLQAATLNQARSGPSSIQPRHFVEEAFDPQVHNENDPDYIMVWHRNAPPTRIRRGPA